MRVLPRLLQYAARVTLFTRQNCSLCDTAKLVLKDVRKARSFEYEEIDVMSKGQEQWKAVYEFDAPVVSLFGSICPNILLTSPAQLHVQSISHTYAKPDIITTPEKLFHRFKPQEVEKLIDEFEGTSHIGHDHGF